MAVVGVIEMAVGVSILIAAPRIGAYVEVDQPERPIASPRTHVITA